MRSENVEIREEYIRIINLMRWRICLYEIEKYWGHGSSFGKERTGSVPCGIVELKKKWQRDIAAVCTYSN